MEGSEARRALDPSRRRLRRDARHPGADRDCDYAGNEPHHLLAAESIVSDRDVDLTDEYTERAYASWYPRELETDGQVVGGRLVEPHGVGFALLIAPAYAIGGARAVQGQMLVAAGARVRARRGAGAADGARAVRDRRRRRWSASRRPRSRPSTTITPGVPAAVLLAGAALCALAVRERPRLRYVFGGALLLAALPWLGWTFVAPGVVVALGAGGLDAARAAAAGGARRRRGARGLARLLRDDQRPLLRRPDAARGGARRSCRSCPLGYVERLPRLAGLWLDRDVGLLRWAPLLALVFFAGWLLYRSRRDQLARVAPARREAEACAGLLLGVVGAQLVVVALFSAAGLRGRRSRACRSSPRCRRRRADGLGPAPHPAAARRRAGRSSRSARARGWSWPSARGSLERLAGGRHHAAVGPAGQRLPELHRRAAVARAAVRAARRRRGAARGGASAARRASGAAPPRPRARQRRCTECASSSPPTPPSHDALRAAARRRRRRCVWRAPRARAALAALDHAAARRPPPARSIPARPRARRSSRCSTTWRTVLDGGIRLGDPRTVAHLHPAPLIAAAAAELAVGVTNQSMDAFDASPAATFVEDALVALAGARARAGPTRLRRDDDGRHRLEPARAAAGARPRGRGRPPRRAAAQRLADRRLRGLPRQHPPLGRAARARHRGRDRRRRPTHAGALSLEAFDEATRGEHVIAFVGTAGTTDLGAIDPLDALADRAQRARRLVPRRRRRRLRASCSRRASARG